MEEIKKSDDVLAEIHKNCQLALQSISNVLPEVADLAVKEELLRQHEEYERIGSKASLLAKDKNVELKNPNPIKKALMWTSIKMNALKDDSRAHIAEMMIQGTVAGITALKTSLAQLSPNYADEEVKTLAKELLRTEEGFEKSWKSLIA